MQRNQAQTGLTRFGARAFVICSLFTLISTATTAVGSSTAGASQPVTITLYNGQHVQTTEALVAGFTKQTGIKVAVRSGEENTFDDQIIAEGKRSPADILFTEDSPSLEYLQQKGLLAKVDASTLAKVPSRYNSLKHDWVGVSARVSVLVYNPSLMKRSQLPTSVLQLANPRYRGKLAIAPGEVDFQPLVGSVLESYGKAATLKWLEGIKANAGSHVYPNNETIDNEVNRGTVAFGVINQYYWYRMRAQIGAAKVHSLITYFAPRDPGYVVNVSGAGILKSSKHQAAAQKFLAYLVSKAGQEVIAHSISFEYPIASGVKTAQPETPFNDLKPNAISVGKIGSDTQVIALLREAQLL